jgi:D-galactarolactone isomerase
MRRLGLERVVAVQSILYGVDNRCMLDGMLQIGAGARGVAVVSEHTPMAELQALDARGVRGARAYMLPGGVFAWDRIPALANRVADVGWHVQVQLDGRELPAHVPMLASLPARWSSITWASSSTRSSPRIRRSGRCCGCSTPAARWVKLSAPTKARGRGRPATRTCRGSPALVAHAPERLLWRATGRTGARREARRRGVARPALPTGPRWRRFASGS